MDVEFSLGMINTLRLLLSFLLPLCMLDIPTTPLPLPGEGVGGWGRINSEAVTSSRRLTDSKI
jgi:hypothetical protein